MVTSSLVSLNNAWLCSTQQLFRSLGTGVYINDILHILVKAQISLRRGTFNGFSDVFCIDEKKVICYQLELLRYADTHFDTERRDVLSLLLSSVDIHAAFSLSVSTHPSLATWNLEEGV